MGSCRPVPLGLIPGLVLICILGTLTLIALILAIVSVSLKLKKKKDMANQTKVKYTVQGDIEMSCDRMKGLHCSGKDVIICQPGEEVYNDNIYNSLIKK
jgi:hypothetical protein